ncbi:unnamed protein product [Chrysodeixis includens]|uniref:Uncharacterized protein n=1 Tax=Chrysodeixis includens TaxID=689277 RepID=A0A9N8KPB2_CHRIL|nr:unnamed protein product [Chrysodeixis includens]
MGSFSLGDVPTTPPYKIMEADESADGFLEKFNPGVVPPEPPKNIMAGDDGASTSNFHQMVHQSVINEPRESIDCDSAKVENDQAMLPKGYDKVVKKTKKKSRSNTHQWGRKKSTKRKVDKQDRVKAVPRIKRSSEARTKAPVVPFTMKTRSQTRLNLVVQATSNETEEIKKLKSPAHIETLRRDAPKAQATRQDRRGYKRPQPVSFEDTMHTSTYNIDVMRDQFGNFDPTSCEVIRQLMEPLPWTRWSAQSFEDSTSTAMATDRSRATGSGAPASSASPPVCTNHNTCPFWATCGAPCSPPAEVGLLADVALPAGVAPAAEVAAPADVALPADIAQPAAPAEAADVIPPADIAQPPAPPARAARVAFATRIANMPTAVRIESAGVDDIAGVCPGVGADSDDLNLNSATGSVAFKHEYDPYDFEYYELRLKIPNVSNLIL